MITGMEGERVISTDELIRMIRGGPRHRVGLRPFPEGKFPRYRITLPERPEGHEPMGERKIFLI
jgi:hypothetical protein